MLGAANLGGLPDRDVIATFGREKTPVRRSISDYVKIGWFSRLFDEHFLNVFSMSEEQENTHEYM